MKDKPRQLLINTYGYDGVVGDEPPVHLTGPEKQCLYAGQFIERDTLRLTKIGEMRINGLYICRTCGQTKSNTDMQSQSQCRECQRAYMREYYHNGNKPLKIKRERLPDMPDKGVCAKILDDFYKYYQGSEWFNLATGYDWEMMQHVLPHLLDYKLEIKGDKGRFIAVIDHRHLHTIVFGNDYKFLEKEDDDGKE